MNHFGIVGVVCSILLSCRKRGQYVGAQACEIAVDQVLEACVCGAMMGACDKQQYTVAEQGMRVWNHPLPSTIVSHDGGYGGYEVTLASSRDPQSSARCRQSRAHVTCRRFCQISRSNTAATRISFQPTSTAWLVAAYLSRSCAAGFLLACVATWAFKRVARVRRGM